MKKIFCLFTTFLIVFTTIGAPVSAANDAISVNLSSSVTEVVPGDTFTISLNIPTTAEFFSGTLDIVYDNTKVKVKSGKLSEDVYGGQVFVNYSANTVRVAAYSDGFSPITTELIATLTFDVLDDATGKIDFDVKCDNDGGIYVYDSTNFIESSKFVDAGTFTTTGVSVKVNSFTTNTVATVGLTSTEFNITITDCPNNGIIYVGIYDGTVLKACGLKKFTSAITSEKITVDNVTGGTFKVFIWGEDGTPLLETPEVKSLN